MTKQFEREIVKVTKLYLELCSIVKENLAMTVKGLKEKDESIFNVIVERDAEVDRLEIEVEEECLKLIALHQPVARELRYIISILKSNNDIERIGDLTVNISSRIKHLKLIGNLYKLPEMAEKVVLMFEKSLESFIQKDDQLALEVCRLDDQVDALKRETQTTVLSEMDAQKDNFKPLLTVFTISRQLERIADLSTNIAEDVIYLQTGEIVRHKSIQELEESV